MVPVILWYAQRYSKISQAINYFLFVHFSRPAGQKHNRQKPTARDLQQQEEVHLPVPECFGEREFLLADQADEIVALSGTRCR